MLVFSAADFEDFLEPRPDLPASLEGEVMDIVSLLAANRWPFLPHATSDESITRFLNVFEEVDRDAPFKGLNWFFDYCETISDRNLERVRGLGGGIAIHYRMAYQGEYFMNRNGRQAAERTPPVRKMIEFDIPVGAGTDATRVASYNPWVSLYSKISKESMCECGRLTCSARSGRGAVNGVRATRAFKASDLASGKSFTQMRHHYRMTRMKQGSSSCFWRVPLPASRRQTRRIQCASTTSAIVSRTRSATERWKSLRKRAA
jgi:hypothetical protein